MRPIQFEILKAEAEKMGAEYLSAAKALADMFIAARSLAIEAESYGENQFLVPAFFRSGVSVELPCPLRGLTPTSRTTFTAAANDGAAIEAAKARAAELI